MGLQWTDIQEIAIQLNDKYPKANPQYVNFTDLYQWVMALEEFEGNPQFCGERILEGIQQAWIEEKS
jgi:FeS assembly protein IscX